LSLKFGLRPFFRAKPESFFAPNGSAERFRTSYGEAEDFRAKAKPNRSRLSGKPLKRKPHSKHAVAFHRLPGVFIFALFSSFIYLGASPRTQLKFKIEEAPAKP